MANAPLRRSKAIGYGAGDYGFNLFFATASLYLLYYYTDVLGLAADTAGWIFAVALIWDAISDPMMGYIASRTRSRWGRYRPYLLFGTLPLAVSWVLMFLPTSFEGSALVAFTLATHMLFRTLYTVASMPYLSLSAAMTFDSAERGLLATYRMVAAILAGLTAAFFLLKLATVLGQGDMQRGFFLSSILFAAVASLFLLLVFFVAEEQSSKDLSDADQPSARDMFAMLRSNSAFWLIAGSSLMAGMSSTFFGKTIPKHFKYALERPDLIGPALGGLAASALLSLVPWTLLMRRTSKRTVSLAGTATAITGYALFLAVGDSVSPVTVLALFLLGVGGGAGAITFWAMIPDTVEYGEWRSGVRAEGMIFGLISFVQKASLGLSVGLLGELLAAIGYVANRPQAADTLANMHLLMTLGPILFITAGASFIFFYPLDGKLHGRLVKALGRRGRERLAMTGPART